MTFYKYRGFDIYRQQCGFDSRYKYYIIDKTGDQYMYLHKDGGIRIGTTRDIDFKGHINAIHAMGCTEDPIGSYVSTMDKEQKEVFIDKFFSGWYKELEECEAYIDNHYKLNAEAFGDSF